MSTSSREPRPDAAQARRRLEAETEGDVAVVVVSARALVVEVRLGQRGWIGLARSAILLLAAIGGPGASESAGGPAERHALPVGAQPRLAPVAPADALEEGVKARPEVDVGLGGG